MFILFINVEYGLNQEQSGSFHSSPFKGTVVTDFTGSAHTGRSGYNLPSLIEYSEAVPRVRKMDVREGDWVIVKTRNSVYSIRLVGKSDCIVSGGWFDRRGKSPMRTTVAGCTWGGSVIRVDILAALGLRIEFGNRLTTTEARRILLLRKEAMN